MEKVVLFSLTRKTLVGKYKNHLTLSQLLMVAGGCYFPGTRWCYHHTVQFQTFCQSKDCCLLHTLNTVATPRSGILEHPATLLQQSSNDLYFLLQYYNACMEPASVLKLLTTVTVRTSVINNWN